MMRPTPIYEALADLWQLSPAVRKRLWGALSKAQWTIPASFRRSLVLFEQGKGTHHPQAAWQLVHERCRCIEFLYTGEWDCYTDDQLHR